MATIDQLIDDLQAWTSVGSTRLSDAVAQECLNTAMRKLQRIHPWVRVATIYLTVDPTTGQVPLPTGFVTEHAVWLVDTGQSDPSRALSPIERTTRTEWFNVRLADTQDQTYPAVAAPGGTDTQRYYLHENVLQLVPVPSSAVRLALDYEPVTVDLVANSAHENLLTREYPDIVREGGLAEAYAYLHEPDRAMFHAQRFAASAKDGITQREAASYAGKTPIVRGV